MGQNSFVVAQLSQIKSATLSFKLFAFKCLSDHTFYKKITKSIKVLSCHKAS
jgi:hypothetical protein